MIFLAFITQTIKFPVFYPKVSTTILLELLTHKILPILEFFLPKITGPTPPYLKVLNAHLPGAQ